MTETTHSLRVASWNMQAAMGSQRYLDYALRAHENVWCFGRKKKHLLAASRELERFDLVALQECDLGSMRSGFVHQGFFLAQEAKFEHTAFHSSRRVGPVASSALAVLSRFPLRNTRSYALPSLIPGRGALETTVDLPGASFRLLVVHLSLSRRARARQLDWIALWRSQTDLPTVILGDFNAQSGCPSLQGFSANMDGLHPALKSFPSWNPSKGLDHILTVGLEALEPSVCRLPGSDHMVVARELRLGSHACSTRHERGRGPAED